MMSICTCELQKPTSDVFVTDMVGKFKSSTQALISSAMSHNSPTSDLLCPKLLVFEECFLRLSFINTASCAWSNRICCSTRNQKSRQAHNPEVMRLMGWTLVFL